MTNREITAPQFDRLIEIVGTTTGPGFTPYRFDGTSNAASPQGTWQSIASALTVGRFDSDDVELPNDLAAPLAARVAVDGGAAVDLQITNVSVAQTVQGQPLSYRLSYSGA